MRLNLEFEQRDDLRESTKLFSPISLRSLATCLRWAAAISKISYLPFGHETRFSIYSENKTSMNIKPEF